MIPLYNDYETGTYGYIGNKMKIDRYITSQYKMIRILYKKYKEDIQSLAEVFPYADQLRNKKHDILEELDIFTKKRTNKVRIVEYLDEILEELILVSRQKITLKEV